MKRLPLAGSHMTSGPVSHDSDQCHMTLGPVSHDSSPVSHDLLVEIALGDGNEIGVDGGHDGDEGRFSGQS